MARISPATPQQWTPEMREFFDGFRTTVAADPQRAGKAGLNLVGTLARYPALAMPFLSFNAHLLSGTSLTDRQRELLVLRVASVRRSDYEWAQHVILAETAGVTKGEILRVADGPNAPEWSPLERSLLSAVDELLADGVVSELTWSALAEEFNTEQLMDMVFTVGCYSMLAMALRSFDVNPEPELAPYLPAVR
ncbi:carboxymuconolactone decarboxylase family protein [Rhodococcus sp. MS16]|uniref:Alkylhydroperoxidase family enzyme n=1 Tax=Nocardia globerula TaxID=1818 RepID=A0A652YYN5_NOCGL|nr:MULTISPECIES: carboxymuconolactone decarboxylase family protein [Rhodococcus]NMD58833.1 carboxymuconolactone decarboxylase family protein [Nocardia globerula]NRI66224.1 carboxymuconolactone decarboxylase family protein [Rhodococcus sp. MS16]PVX65105.1 alkylhydroperoxidase family enzyme [Rhodococcus globerulus]